MASARSSTPLWLAAMAVIAAAAFWFGTHAARCAAPGIVTTPEPSSPVSMPQPLPRSAPAPLPVPDNGSGTVGRTNARALPADARQMVALIQQGGPYRYPQDGTVFGNREGLLPAQPRGYYREYTVSAPGAHARGTRRIITGGTPPAQWYYSDDHYRSFREFQP